MIILATLLSSCAATQLVPDEVSPSLTRLEANNRFPLQLALHSELPTEVSAGHQFLFTIIPLGTVLVEQPAQHLAQTLRERLALDGWRTRTSAPGKIDHLPLLSIEFDSLQVSAYDLLVTRMLYCSVNLRVSFTTSGGVLSDSVNESVHLFRRFGFKEQLNELWQECLSSASNSIANFISRGGGSGEP